MYERKEKEKENYFSSVEDYCFFFVVVVIVAVRLFHKLYSVSTTIFFFIYFVCRLLSNISMLKADTLKKTKIRVFVFGKTLKRVSYWYKYQVPNFMLISAVRYEYWYEY